VKKVIFSGDLMFGGELGSSIKNNIIDINSLFKNIRNKYTDHDFFVMNLEKVITSRSIKYARKDKVSLLKVENDIFKNFNINNNMIFNLCNNHIHDFGNNGILDTLKSIDSVNAKYFGLKHKLNKNISPFEILKTSEGSIGLIAFTTNGPSVNSITDSDNYFCVEYDDSNIIEEMRILKSQNPDIIVVNMHWGNEQHFFPSPRQRRLARLCVDHGANLVLGHHPHVVQGNEIYKNVNIYYSLGHFLFSKFNYITKGYKKWDDKNKLGFLLEVIIKNQSIKKLNLYPIYQNENYSIEVVKRADEMKYLSNIPDINGNFDLDDKSYKNFWINYHYNILNKQLLVKAKGFIHFQDGSFKLFKRLLRILISFSSNFLKRKIKYLSEYHL
jgi:poly-gamma-glutamate capsule biosynthesis protein CapA/YwtB (metallophosphatase superfamily)